MKTFLSPNPRLKFFDDNGKPLVNGILKTFLANSSIPVATYNESGKNAVQVRLDGRGEADVRLLPDVSYKFVLCRADGSTIWSSDNVRVGGGAGGSSSVSVVEGDGISVEPIQNDDGSMTYVVSAAAELLEKVATMQEDLGKITDPYVSPFAQKSDLKLEADTREQKDAELTVAIDDKTAIKYGGATIRNVAVTNTDTDVNMTSTDGFNVELPTKKALENYYTKAEVDAKSEGLAEFVTELPETGDSSKTYYVGPKGEGADKYEEWRWDGSKWIMVGEKSIDLDPYLKQADAAATYKPLTTEDTLTDDLTDDTELYSTAQGGYGASTTKWFRAKCSKIWAYVKAKADSIFATKTELDAEATTRAEADSALQTAVDGKQASIGTVGNSSTPVYFNNGVATAVDTSSMSVGVADEAKSVEWNDVANKPSTFTPSSHRHGLLKSSLGVTIPNFTKESTDLGFAYFSDYTQIRGYMLASIRTNANAPSWILGNYAAGIIFGGSDTKGVISVEYGNPLVQISGGNGTAPVWTIKLTGSMNGKYNLDTFATNTALTNGLATKQDALSFPLTAEQGGTGESTLNAGANALINALTTDSSTPVDADYYVSQYVAGGTSTTTFHRRPMSALWSYISGKISSVLGLTASNYGGKAATATYAYKVQDWVAESKGYKSLIKIARDASDERPIASQKNILPALFMGDSGDRQLNSVTKSDYLTWLGQVNDSAKVNGWAIKVNEFGSDSNTLYFV